MVNPRNKMWSGLVAGRPAGQVNPKPDRASSSIASIGAKARSVVAALKSPTTSMRGEGSASTIRVSLASPLFLLLTSPGRTEGKCTA